MSKNNNVNPGQYKVAGRERQGEDVVPQPRKSKTHQGSRDGGYETKRLVEEKALTIGTLLRSTSRSRETMEQLARARQLLCDGGQRLSLDKAETQGQFQLCIELGERADRDPHVMAIPPAGPTCVPFCDV